MSVKFVVSVIIACSRIVASRVCEEEINEDKIKCIQLKNMKKMKRDKEHIVDVLGQLFFLLLVLLFCLLLWKSFGTHMTKKMKRDREHTVDILGQVRFFCFFFLIFCLFSFSYYFLFFSFILILLLQHLFFSSISPFDHFTFLSSS